MAKVNRKAAKSNKKDKAKKKGAPKLAESLINAINRMVASLKGIVTVVENRSNNHRLYIKGEEQSRASHVGEIRPLRGKVNLGLNKDGDDGKSFKKMESNFATLHSYEVEENGNIAKAVKNTVRAIEALYEDDDE